MLSNCWARDPFLLSNMGRLSGKRKQNVLVGMHGLTAIKDS